MDTKDLYSAMYAERRTFIKYDNENIIVYLNERVIENFVPEDAPEGTEPKTMYEYTGTEKDGGTIVPAVDTTEVGEIANGLIRTKYTASDEAAIHRHHMLLLADPTIEKADEYTEEWNIYNAWAIQCVATAKSWIS